MFPSVDEKLRAAEHFLQQLRDLEKRAGHFASIDPFLVRVNLDGFFFEIVSAKDFFLQEINDQYGGGVGSRDVDEDTLLASATLPKTAKTQVKRIKQLLSDCNTWLWKLNNYRNSATHRNPIGKAEVAFGDAPGGVQMYLFNDPDEPSKGRLQMEIMQYCEEALTQMTEFLGNLYLGLP